MSDTQWPRFFVFKKDSHDEPHLNCGTVHAPDVELALQNARDVFVRRPECVSLWVVPAGKVVAKTAEELEREPPEPAHTDASVEPYAVFLKKSHSAQHAYAGEVEAATPTEALAEALDAWGESGPLAYWVVPKRVIHVSSQDDQDSWFEPAREKHYRQSSFYHTERLIREIKAEQKRGKGVEA
ncbi:MAG: hypothetical protein R3191_03265 [Anaerolineales bacterium]|nr:hypothetical protein [Anaerolineales bacterium]